MVSENLIGNNTPTFTWVSIRGLNIQKNGEIYSIEDLKTNKEFIYWEIENPHILKASSDNLGTSSTRYLIYRNNKGEAIEVPNDDLTISFSDNENIAMQEKILALSQKNNDTGKKIVAVEQTLDGVKQTIGEWNTSKDGTLTENLTKIKQDSKNIELSVQETNKKFNNNEFTSKLRESFNKAIIDMNSNLGLLSSELDLYYKDNEVDSKENQKLKILLNNFKGKENRLLVELDKVIELAKKKNDPVKLQILNEEKTKFKNAVENLISFINTSTEDSIVVPTDITTTTNLISKCNTSIVSLKNAVDDFIFLGFGGILVDEISRINIDKNKLELEVSQNKSDTDNKISKIEIKTNEINSVVAENKKNNDKKFSQIKQTTDSISSTVSNKVGNNEIISKINQSPENISIMANKLNLQGLVTISSLQTPGQVVIDGGNIKSKTLRAEDILGGVFSATDEINFVGGARITSKESVIPGRNGMCISSPGLIIQATRWGVSSSGDAKLESLKVGNDGLYVDNDELHFGKNKYYNGHSSEYVSNITVRNGNLSVAYDIWADNFNSRITGGSITGASSENVQVADPFETLSKFNTIMNEDNRLRLFSTDIYDKDKVKENTCLLKDANDNVCLDNSSIIANLVAAVNGLKKQNDELIKMVANK